MKRITALFLLIIIIFANASGCTIFKKEPIRIGFVGTLQGPTADLALNGKRGAEIAVAEINNNGGINGRLVELVVKDSVNDTQVARDILEEFIEDGVGLVIGDFTSSLTECILEDLNLNNILYISPTVGSEQFVGLDDNLIRFNSTSINQANSIFMQTEKVGDMTFLVFKDSHNAAFSYSVCDNFKERVETVGGSVLAEITYDGNDTIKPDEILAAMDEYAKQTDGVILASDAVNAAIIIRTIKKNGFDINIYTSRWANTPDLYSITGKDSEGVYTLDIIDPESKSDKYINFVSKFSEYYGTQPAFSALSSYEVMMVLYEAISETKSTLPKKIKAYIINTSNFSGLQSDFEIDEFGDCNRDYILYVIRDGMPVKMDQIS